MNIDIFQIDTFTSEQFYGNPAAVCLLPSWLEDGVLQRISAENNLSETAFLVGEEGNYELRWFTPKSEVALCGHATLASAFVVLRLIDSDLSEVLFSTKSGELRVTESGKLFSMD